MSLLNTTISHKLQPGAYEAKIEDYFETAVKKNAQTDEVIRDAMIVVTLKCDNTTYTDFWSTKRIPFIAEALQTQFGMQDRDCTLLEILETGKKVPFAIILENTTQYGLQVKYQKPADEIEMDTPPIQGTLR